MMYIKKKINDVTVVVCYIFKIQNVSALTAVSPPMTDDVPCVSGPAEEHDLPLRPRDLPALWRPHE